MIKFSDGKHCHWVYKIGQYISMYAYPTKAEAEEALGNREGYVIQGHGTECACDLNKPTE